MECCRFGVLFLKWDEWNNKQLCTLEIKIHSFFKFRFSKLSYIQKLRIMKVKDLGFISKVFSLIFFTFWSSTFRFIVIFVVLFVRPKVKSINFKMTSQTVVDDLPSGMEILEHQVAGHTFQTGTDEIGKLQYTNENEYVEYKNHCQFI